MAYNILVVDDEQSIADLIELYLQNENYHIFKTTTEITVEKDGKDESIYLFSRRKSQSIDHELR